MNLFFKKTNHYRTILISLLGFGCIFPAQAKVYDITDFGAKGDSVTLNSKAIQRAIDECATNGGGTVYFPAGTYISGTIWLKDNIHLYLESGATLLCSTDVSQFPLQTSKVVSLRPRCYSLIYAENKSNISISGNGTIVGQGNRKPYHISHKDQDAAIVRPKVICMIECKNIKIRDITLKNSPFWMQHYLACEDLLIDGITVSNRRSSVNNDGIDIDCCRNVRISNCNIDSEDDAIVLKSTSNRLCENVTINGCVLSSHCNALKCGTESNGGFRNITVSNCVIFDTYLSGIALEIVDGGVLDLVNISNITMNRVNNPLFIKLGNRARPYGENIKPQGIGEMKNIQITNIQANDVGEFIEIPDMEFSHHNARPKAAAIFIDGLPERNIFNISLDNFFINFKGGGTKEDALTEVPLLPKAYPEYSSYGNIRPSYGFYCRFASQLNLKNIVVTHEKEDDRPAYIFDHVDHLVMDNIGGEIKGNGEPAVTLIHCGSSYLKENPERIKKKDIKMDRLSKLTAN